MERVFLIYVESSHIHTIETQKVHLGEENTFTAGEVFLAVKILVWEGCRL